MSSGGKSKASYRLARLYRVICWLYHHADPHSGVIRVKLKRPISLETAFGVYVISEQLGEGGAGRVYGGIAPEGAPIAIKVLASDKASADRRARFKNEIAFWQKISIRILLALLITDLPKSRASRAPSTS